jgi:hypothetical protein
MERMSFVKAFVLKAAVASLPLVVLSACGGGDGGSAGSGSTPVTFAGTTAVGKALANATVSYTCRVGSASTTSDTNGNYTLVAYVQTPCVVTATLGSVTLKSLAPSPGVINVTPLTDLLVSYVSGQLGITVSALVSNFASNTNAQSLLSDTKQVAAAETAVVTFLNSTYQTSISITGFLTTTFTAGSGTGVDGDLEALGKTSAVDPTTGQPSSAASDGTNTKGKDKPFVPGGGSATGATGGNSAAGGTSR